MKHLHLVERVTAKKLKMTRYFTGRACQRGHVSERQTGNFKCCECDKLDRAGDARKEYIKAYHAKADRPSYMKKWVSKNSERKKNVSREYYERNRERRIIESREYYHANKSRIKASNREAYLRENSEYAARLRESAIARKRRAVAWSSDLTTFVFSECIHMCALREVLSGVKWQVDHMWPLKGRKVSGLHVWNNLQVIPSSLNLEKGNRPAFTEPFSWMKRYEVGA